MATRVDQGHPQPGPAMDWPTATEWRERQRQLPTALRVLRDSWEAEDERKARESAEEQAFRMEMLRRAAIAQAENYLRHQGETGAALLVAPHTATSQLLQADHGAWLEWSDLPGTHKFALLVVFESEEIVVAEWRVYHPEGMKKFIPGELLAALEYAWKYAPAPF